MSSEQLTGEEDSDHAQASASASDIKGVK